MWVQPSACLAQVVHLNQLLSIQPDRPLVELLYDVPEPKPRPRVKATSYGANSEVRDLSRHIEASALVFGHAMWVR
jgi:hypothetical protein